MAERHRIGALRWLVTLAVRDQQPQAPPLTGINEVWVNIRQVHVAIEPLRAVTFYGALVAENPITHVITLRWVDWLDNTVAFRRTLTTPDGKQRSEIYRVRRYLEVDGRKRFVDVECQQEVIIE